MYFYSQQIFVYLFEQKALRDTETHSLSHINTHRSHSLTLGLCVDVISKGDLCTLTGEFMRGSCFLVERPAKKLLSFFFFLNKKSKNKKKKSDLKKIYYNLCQGCMIHPICLFE